MKLRMAKITWLFILSFHVVCFLWFGCKSRGDIEEKSIHATESINFDTPSELVQEILNNESFKWDSTRTRHFIIYYLPDSYAKRHLEFLRDRSEEAISRAVEVLRLERYSFGIRLFMLESRDQIYEFLEMRPKGIALYKHDAILMVYNEEVRPYLRHEVFHIVSIKVWGMPETWLREGSAVFADGGCLGYELDELGSYLVRTGKAVELRDLIENFSKTEDMITYLQSGSLFKYIYENYDVNQVKLFWQNRSTHIQETLKTDLWKLQEDWRANLLRIKLDTSKIDWSELLEKGCG